MRECSEILSACGFEMNILHSSLSRSVSYERPTAPPKRVLHRVQSSASSFNLKYPLVSFRSSSSCLRLLPRLPAPLLSISLTELPQRNCFFSPRKFLWPKNHSITSFRCNQRWIFVPPYWIFSVRFVFCECVSTFSTPFRHVLRSIVFLIICITVPQQVGVQ